MNIDVVIEKLKAIKAKRGNVPVLINMTSLDGECHSIADVDYIADDDSGDAWVNITAKREMEDTH